MPASDHDGSVVGSLANRVAQRFGSLDQVEAAALSGSQTSELRDRNSDVDLYIYVTRVIPLEIRRQIAGEALKRMAGLYDLSHQN